MYDDDFIYMLLLSFDLPCPWQQKMQVDGVAMVHWGQRLTMEMYLQFQISIEMD